MIPPSASTQIDSRVQVVTPENIAFEYRVAGPFSRLMAYVLDLVIIAALYAASGLLAMLVFAALDLPGVGWLFFFASMFLLYWFYGGLFEAFWNGQTPGKRMTGLRVLRTDGRPVTGLQAVLRNLLRLVDSMPWAMVPLIDDEFLIPLPTFLLGLVVMTVNRRFQRLGDLAVGTMVVAEDRSRFGKIVTPEDVGIDQLVEQVPANFRPSPQLAKALSHYVNRRRLIGPARRQEIAQHVGSVMVEQFGMPSDTNRDLLLCAVYVRASHLTEAADADQPQIAPKVPIPAGASIPTPTAP